MVDTSEQPTRTPFHERPSVLGSLCVAGPICYGVGLAGVAAPGRSLEEVACFQPADVEPLTLVGLLAVILMATGAVLLLFVTPWLLGTAAIRRLRGGCPTAAAWSLAANSAGLILLCLGLRSTVGISRASFLVAWLGWTAAWWLPMLRSRSLPAEGGSAWGRRLPGMFVGTAAVILGIALFWPEQFVQCYNGDGIETLQLARSLRTHLLPYWEIETLGRFGTVIVNPSLINSYWTCALQLLLGEGELATRLPFWVWWLGIFATALRMVRGPDAGMQILPAVPLAVLMLLAAVWYTFYAGYYPYMADLANPGVVDAMFTLLLLLALDCLRRNDVAGWVVLGVMASLVLYAGAVMFLLTAAAAVVWQPIPRRKALWAGGAGMAVMAGLAAFYVAWGASDGSLPGWASTLRQEYLKEYFAPVPRWRENLLFLAYFLIGCGVLPVFGAVGRLIEHRSQPGEAWDRTAASVVVVYLLIIMGSGCKNLHYLGPLLPIPLILWLRPQADGPRSGWAHRAAPLLTALSLGACLFLCWPASRPVFVLNRQLGARTAFQTDCYEEASRWGRIAWDLYDAEDLGWAVSQHVWVHYSELRAAVCEPRPLLVTEGAAPRGQGYRLVRSSAAGVRLYSREGSATDWLKTRSPPAGSARFPWVFRPIAVVPPPRHLAEQYRHLPP